MREVGAAVNVTQSTPNHAELFDVAIVGGGISGTCAAIALAKGGARVLVIESGEFPRHKVCGEFLSPESKAVFARLGVLENIVKAGATEVTAARVVARSGHALDLAMPHPALSLSRFRLDEILFVGAKEAGAQVLCNTRVRLANKVADVHFLATTQGEFQARVLLNAAGRHASWCCTEAPSTPDTSTVRPKYVGLKAHFAEASLPCGLVELHPWAGGYCGLVQVEDGTVNACLLARYDSLDGRSPEEFWSWLLNHLPALRARLQYAKLQTPWLATGNVQFTQSTPIAGNVWNCGDAAGFIHPLAGDGMAMAARSGELAAAILSSHLRGEVAEEMARGIYEAAWQREFASRLQWAGRFQKLLIDSQLVSPTLSLFSRLPALGHFAVRATRG